MKNKPVFNKILKILAVFHKYFIPALIIAFLCITIPLSLMRPSGGRSGERQGQTAGAIRLFCQQPDRPPLSGPMVQFGNSTFNLEIPVFEWIQGKIAYFIDSPNCQSVEPVAKVISTLFGAIGIIAALLISTFVFSPTAGLITAFLLASDELWLRYSTYSMIDVRMISMALMAIYFTLRRMPFLSFTFWSLTILQKPQAFAYFSTYWATLEFVIYLKSNSKIKKIFFSQKLIRTLTSVIAAVIVGYIYYYFSSITNEQNDLPWTQWMGPRSRAWFFGDFSDRFKYVFYKSLFLDWIKKSHLNTSLILIFFAISYSIFASKPKKHISSLFNALSSVIPYSLPVIVGRFFITFVFYNVFVVHEYYSLPLNAGSAIVAGIVIAATIDWLKLNFNKINITYYYGLVCLILFGIGFTETTKYLDYISNINNPNDWRYLVEWRKPVFPKPISLTPPLVVMASPVGGRDILYLYLTERHGYSWCSQNEKYAPRKFWNDQGVKYVAWWTGADSKTRINTWVVRTIEEELALARKNNWSSDISDVWNGKSMSEWSKIAGLKEKDPCKQPTEYDPRNW